VYTVELVHFILHK